MSSVVDDDDANSGIWYPTRDDLIRRHEAGLRIAGGHPTARRLMRSLNGFDALVEDMKEIEGIYAKAAYLLRETITRHFFSDGNHRAGFGVTMLFLRMNDYPHEIPSEVAIPFIKRIRSYTLKEIEEWPRNETQRPGS